MTLFDLAYGFIIISMLILAISIINDVRKEVNQYISNIKLINEQLKLSGRIKYK